MERLKAEAESAKEEKGRSVEENKAQIEVSLLPLIPAIR
jgi:hypothetical protein